MNTTKQLACAVVIATGVGVHAVAGASNFFDSLTLTPYDQSNVIAGDGPGGEWAASSFSNIGECPSPCRLDSITLSLRTDQLITTPAAANASLGQLSVSVFENVSITGGFPDPLIFDGDLLGELVLDPLTSYIAGGFNNVGFTPADPLELESGVMYWAFLDNEAVTPLGGWGWQFGEDISGEKAAFNLGGLDGVVSNATYAMQVEVSPVPLPGAFWLMGSALVGIGSFQAARRRPSKAR